VVNLEGHHILPIRHQKRHCARFLLHLHVGELGAERLQIWFPVHLQHPGHRVPPEFGPIDCSHRAVHVAVGRGCTSGPGFGTVLHRFRIVKIDGCIFNRKNTLSILSPDFIPNWTKDGKPLDLSRVSWGTNFKKSMKLFNVSYKDAGEYKCTFENAKQLPKKFRVTVESEKETDFLFSTLF